MWRANNRWPTLDKKPVWNLSFSPDGTLLAIVGGGEVWLWDVASRQQVATLQHDGYWTRSLSFSPDGTLLAIAGFGQGGEGYEYSAWLWDVASRKQVATLQHDGYWGQCAFVFA